MTDYTIYAEALIATVARAFYEDDAICLIDVLLRDKYLRDDDMGPRLSLQPKQLRRTLQFLQDEHIVKFEEVDDLAQGGSQASKYWYIDYNAAVHSIRLRLFLLRSRLERAEMDARSSSFYLCPGYKGKRCNGRYTESEAQQVVDKETGLFLCQECSNAYENSANPPELETYTLQLVDNAKELKQAVNNMRRVNVQLSGKMIGNNQIRPGIYDLLQKVRVKGKGPLTSNLPSENYALEIGSKRLAGTGRTAGIKAKKRAQQGQGEFTVGTESKRADESDLLFLKNAIGQEIRFTIEKGGGARAQVLATNRRRRRKLMDAAASKVAAKLPITVQWWLMRKKALQAEQGDDPERVNPKHAGLEFLENNIGIMERDMELETLRNMSRQQEQRSNEQDGLHQLVLADESQEMLNWTDDERKAAFQSQYKIEIGRQVNILRLGGVTDGVPKLADEQPADPEEMDVSWEDG